MTKEYSDLHPNSKIIKEDDERFEEFIRLLKERLFVESFERGMPLDDGSLERLPLQLINQEIDKLAEESKGEKKQWKQIEQK